ncbi:HutD/Ves family protein [Ancylomarina longa]|uniref:HutD family protein n=1 Tax=Ancylomarina longa TaxID=2487017 RepID=A0A434AUU9_9BACT|nr:HutD family protein [Ancylomarina longa]RUT78128.1 hypothetical protein DLK05_09790 [Ancylomarina longa]
MQYTIVKADKFETINWSGGTSTQLYIYPETANYQARDFDFRISSAKVEMEQSSFTSLPGISRKIMILEGEITIAHQNHYTKKLEQFDLDAFEGDWKTTSVGKCTDFNLMTARNARGELSCQQLLKQELLDYEVDNNWEMVLIYVHSGKISLSHPKGNQHLEKDDLLVIHQIKSENIRLIAAEDSMLIISKISRN